MYVGGILSHIVIGVLFAGSKPSSIHTIYIYKEESVYILILSGLALKIISDVILFV